MSLRKKHRFRRLRCETLERRLLLTSNAPFNPVLDLQVNSGVIVSPSTSMVSAWNDQAQTANHLRSTGSERPVYGAVQTPTGADAISFDGVDDRLLRDVNDPGGISGPPVNDKSRSMFLVAQFHDAGILGGATYGRGALNQAYGLGVGGPGAESGNLGLQVWPASGNFYSQSAGFTSPGNSTGWMVLSVIHQRDGFDPSDNNWLYRDGVEILAWDHKLNTKLHSTLDLNGNTASRLVLGEGIKEGGHVQMDVAAWLVYDEALSTADRNAVEGYLTATYLNTASNQAPDAVDDLVALADGSMQVIDVLDNDSDPDGFLDPSSVVIVTPPTHATTFSVDPATGEVSYTHDGSGNADSFTYTVNDNLGETSNLATVTIQVSSDVLPVTTGLVSWFESDAGVSLDSGTQVASWLDGSDSGIELFASGDPQWTANTTPSGQPAIVFDGAGDKLEIVGRTALAGLPKDGDDRSVLVVANYLDAQGVQAGFAYGKANANRTFGVGVDGATENLAVQGYLGSNDLVSTTAGVGQGWQLQSVVLDNDTLHHFESGVLVDSWTHTYQTRIDAPLSKIAIGQALAETGYSNFQIGAVLIYDRALSTSERQQVETYLATKYIDSITGNQAPTANNDAYTTPVGGVINTSLDNLPSLLDNDVDPNFDPLESILVSGPSHGTLLLDTDGTFVYTHDGLSSTDDSFTYVANDGTANSNVATVNLSITPLSDDNTQIVRWHGDYFQHLWDSSFPGGSDPAVRENRWLRGGPAAGNQNSTQDIDLDNDGALDDSRVYFDFSLTDPLNPFDTTSKPNGIVYHSELPSARFYGGLSSEFYNYETNRVQQAFIENDGAGGELDDVGYPSPYLTPEYQGLSDYIELVRHPDGRPKKSHIGPHEDFAINIYRPDKPHPLDPLDDPTDNLVTFHAAFIWRKDDFLAGGDSATVSLNAESSFSFQSTRWWDNVGEARWILQSDNGNLYISQFSVVGVQDNWGATNAFADPLSSNWAVYDPAVDQLDFDQSAASWIDPVANNLFNDIQAVGVYLENDTPSSVLTKFSLDEIQFNAILTSNASAVAASSETPSAAAVRSSPDDTTLAGTVLGESDLHSSLSGALLVDSATNSDSEASREVSREEAFAEYTHADQTIGTLSSTSIATVRLSAFELVESPAEPNSERLHRDLDSLEDAFAAWVEA